MTVNAVRTMRAYLDMGWGQVHYRTALPAATKPTMLILHQTPLSSCRYERALPLLAPAISPVAMDTPGYGFSDAPPNDWTIDRYAQLVWEVMDALGRREAILLGRATGALIAMEAAAREPHRCLALVLHGFPLYTPAERSQRLAGFADPYRPDQSGSHLTTIWARIYDQYPNIDAALATSFVQEYLSAGPDYGSAYRAMWCHDPRPSLAKLSCPTILLGGTADRVRNLHARVRELLPDAIDLTLHAATDFVAEQRPELFVSTVLSALKEVGALERRTVDPHSRRS